jgi:putative ABC transport system permease protein
MVRTDPSYDRADVARRIGQEVPNVAVVSSKELMSTSLSRQLQTLTPGLLLIGAGFWIIAVLMIGALFIMVINERRRELGLLQAMGATRGFIFKQVMLESVQLTVLGGVVGLALGAAVILALKSAVASSLGVEFVWPPAGYLAAFTLGYLVLAALTGVIAALYPAAMASRLEPYQSIRSGE